ncbi:MAG TPA: hypothetical protein DDW43_04065 [Nitrosomonas sp.]|nr:hypothetical protein [Nitrosomonas sp.]
MHGQLLHGAFLRGARLTLADSFGLFHLSDGLAFQQEQTFQFLHQPQSLDHHGSKSLAITVGVIRASFSFGKTG